MTKNCTPDHLVPIQYRKGAIDPRDRPTIYLWKIALIAVGALAAWVVGTHLR